MTLLNPAEERAMSAEAARLSQAIDHTKLTFGAEEDETAAIEKLCQEARKARFYAVCVRPRHIALAKQVLAGSPVRVATVIGFPNAKVNLADELKQPTVGQFPTAEKTAETRMAVEAGADELDLVINVAQLKQDVRQGSHQVRDELKAIHEAAQGRPIKVIIETDLLSREEMVAVTRWCAETGMAMVKTSTGMVAGGRGATLENVRLIRQTLAECGSDAGIKASGGIKTREQALAFLDEGVWRIGTSSGLAIVQDDEQGVAGDY